MELVFDFSDAEGVRRRRSFRDAREALFAWSVEEVVPVLARVDAALAGGRHVAGYIGYEAAPAFDRACRVRPGSTLPLLAFGIYDTAPALSEAPPPGAPARHSPWRADTPEAEYVDKVEAIRRAIGAGDVYQVNHTMRLHATLEGDARDYYEQLRSAQNSDYCAFLDLGAFQVLSASPELFFRWRDGLLTTRPMKGTAPRGRWAAEDEALAAALSASEKDRAENLMIVDLLRNDLARLSGPHGVQVPQRFAIERYPTLFQMTSTVTARTRPGLGLADVLRALFPCGSITGAPKYKAMEIIAALETAPRGVYCGAIGYAGPGEVCFNVAIRTVTVDRASGAMVCGVGGGVTWPSVAQAEFAEAMNKAQFLTRPPPRYELFETLLLESGQYVLRARHSLRLAASAVALDFRFDASIEAALEGALDAYAAERPTGRHRVRLRLARDGRVAIDGSTMGAADTEPVSVVLASEPIAREDRLLYHKTTQRELYERHLAAHPGRFDVLLWNREGQLTEFTRGNLIVELDGRLCTPPLDCGLLPGTMRAELLDRGAIEERVIALADLDRATGLWFVNSVRGRLAVRLAAAPLARAGAGTAGLALTG